MPNNTTPPSGGGGSPTPAPVPAPSFPYEKKVKMTLAEYLFLIGDNQKMSAERNMKNQNADASKLMTEIADALSAAAPGTTPSKALDDYIAATRTFNITKQGSHYIVLKA